MRFSTSASGKGSLCVFGLGGDPPRAPPPVPCSVVMVVGRYGGLSWRGGVCEEGQGSNVNYYPYPEVTIGPESLTVEGKSKTSSVRGDSVSIKSG